jgi:DNA-binding beta-propeller fold protein YncE
VGFPIRVAMTPDGRHALVTNARAATLSVFDIRERTLAATSRSRIPSRSTSRRSSGTPPCRSASRSNPDGERAFVAVSGANEVAVIETETWEVVDRWATGREPDALGVIVTAR